MTETAKQILSAKILDMLICPQSGGPLTLNDKTQELVSKRAGLAYPIRDGVPVLLVEDARKI